MATIRITDAADPRIADYRNVPDPDLLRRRGLFVAENRMVVRGLLASTRFRTLSVLVTDAAFDSLQDVLAPDWAATLRLRSGQAGGRPCAADDIPVYVCAKALMEPISGFHIHRGCLALGERPAPVPVADLLAALPRARRVLVLDAITNADNVGAIFRNARAFGVDGVVMGPRCCDPLYRKAIRVSIGATLVVPFAHVSHPAFLPSEVPAKAGAGLDGALVALKRGGFTLVALTPAADAIDLDDFAAEGPPERLALLVGNEGEGLSDEALRASDARVRIAMAPGVDSLNASTATGIALHRIFTS